MSIYYSGTYKRSAGIISALLKQLRLVNLKPVKKIEIKFDPFHPRAAMAREFLFHINSPKVTQTNLNCIIKPNVVCDRSETLITLHLNDSGTIKFLGDNLTTVEILEHINKHVSSQVKEEPVSTSTVKLTSKIESKKKKKK